MKNLALFILVTTLFLPLNAQKKVAIYWDVSMSMSDRHLDRELTYLDNYFKKNQSADVILKIFSNDIIQEGKYTVKNGDCSFLKNELKDVIYDGATSYASLFNNNVDEYLIFTDGTENMNKFKPPTTKPIHIITSVKSSNAINLKLMADLSSGSFVFLSHDINKPKKRNIVENNDEIVEEGMVTGIVTDLANALPGVDIINRRSLEGTTSSKDGSYKIEASEGDVLVFTFLGKETVRVRVSKVKNIDVAMTNINEALEEVEVVGQREKEEVVNLGGIAVDKKRLGYAVETISKENMPKTATNLGNSVNGQFSNFNLPNDVSGKVDISQFLGRGKNMSVALSQYGIVVIDGVPIEQQELGYGRGGTIVGVGNNNIIDPETIVSVSYLKGLAATNKWGTRGRNGVLLITTVNGVKGKSAKKKDVKLGTTATYTGNAENIAELANTSYIEALKESTSIEQAFDGYLEQRKIHGNNAEFYIDVHDYFKGWNNTLLSKRVLSNVYEIAFNDAKMLRALAFKQQENGYFDEALISFKRVLKLEPKQVRSYRDVAMAEVYVGNFKEALKMYNNLDKNRGVSNVNTSGLKKTIANDAKHLIMKHGKALDLSGINDNYNRKLNYKSRIIFEWNDLDAEFDLTVINPQKRFFTWSHTNTENYQRIQQEKETGYGLEEFYLTDSDIGGWTFNMKYYGKTSKDESPTYIKATIYNNFGTSRETKQIKVIRLDKQNIEQTVAKLTVN